MPQLILSKIKMELTAFDEIRKSLGGNLYRDNSNNNAYKVMDVVGEGKIGRHPIPEISIKAYNLTDSHNPQTFIQDTNLKDLKRITEKNLSSEERNNLITLIKNKKI